MFLDRSCKGEYVVDELQYRTSLYAVFAKF